jgi:hypothetical protein
MAYPMTLLGTSILYLRRGVTFLGDDLGFGRSFQLGLVVGTVLFPFMWIAAGIILMLAGRTERHVRVMGYVLGAVVLGGGVALGVFG